MNVNYNKIEDTFSFFNVDCSTPYYISSGKPLLHLPIEPFRIDYYMVSICSYGNVTLEIDNQKIFIPENGVLMATPSTIIRFVETSTDFRMKLLFFEKNFLLKNISDSFIIERLAFFKQRSFNSFQTDEENGARLLRLLEYLEEKSKRDSFFKDEIIRTIIFNLLLETAELLYQNTNTTKLPHQETKDVYFKFLQLLNEKIREQREVKFYTDSLCISNQYLIQILKKATDKTPHQIIDEMLVKEAYIMLNNPSLTISEIAFALNFSSIASFSRFFKRKTGLAPKEFKDKNLR